MNAEQEFWAKIGAAGFVAFMIPATLIFLFIAWGLS